MTRRSPVSLALPAFATVAVALSVTVVAQLADTPVQATDPRSLITGIVRSEDGTALAGAEVWLDAKRVTTDSDGRFSLEHPRAAVVTASAEGHLPRSVAAEPGPVTDLRLTAKPDETVSLRFGGDVMFGRRYYADVAGRGPILKHGATPNDIAGILSGVGPLLDDADLSIVNLETALVADPWNGAGKRPKGLHPTKDLVITSSTASAKALADAGVEVVSLSNNHTFDGLGAGLKSTIAALDAAGVKHFGAGSTVAEAWKPAVLTVRGNRVAFVGCTTVDGRHSGTSYVAEARHGGAAECEPALLTAAVEKARQQAPLVIVTIHGGAEYRRSQTREVRDLAQTATQAGAQLVVGSHPHVVGGLVHTGSSLFAESLGNLAFDQDLWSTLPSYLLRVDARFKAKGGTPAAQLVRADTDPILIDDYRPRPAVGAVAESVARIASGWVEGGVVMNRDSAAVPLGDAKPPTTPTTAKAELAKNEVRRISPGWWLAPAPDLNDQVRAGTDLLFGTGSFEPTVVGASDGAIPAWSLGKYATVSGDASCHSGHGIQLARTPLSTETAVMSPDHRSPVVQGQQLTLVANIRQASEGSRLEVHWYEDMAGPSTKSTKLELPTGAWSPERCQPVRLDLTAPRKAVAAQVYIVLDAPKGGQTIRRLAIDDVSLVDWAPKGRSGRRYDVVGGLRNGTVTLRSDSAAPADSSPLVR